MRRCTVRTEIGWLLSKLASVVVAPGRLHPCHIIYHGNVGGHRQRSHPRERSESDWNHLYHTTDSYTFTANTGDNINLRLGTTGFNAWLQLFGPGGTLLVSGTDDVTRTPTLTTTRRPTVAPYRACQQLVNRRHRHLRAASGAGARGFQLCLRATKAGR